MLDIGGAIASGIKGYITGSQQADERDARQQQLTQQAEMFKMQQKQFQDQQAKAPSELELLQGKVQEMHNTLQASNDLVSMNNLYKAFDGGTLADFNHVIAKDKNLQSNPILSGIQNISTVDINNPEFSNVAKAISDKGGQPVLVNKVLNGQLVQQVGDLALLKANLGYSTFQAKRDAELNQAKFTNSVTSAQNNAISLLGPNASTEDIAAITNPLLPKDKLAAENNIKIESMKLAAAKKGANSATEMLAGMKLNQEMFKQTMDTNSVGIVDSIVSKKPDEKFTQNEVNAAKAIQGDKTLDTKVKDMLTVGNTTVNGLIPVYKKIDNANIDWNALSKVKTKMLALGGDDFANFAKMTDYEKENMYKKMGIETELQSVVANYIKLMSGAAVQNEERTMYNNIIMSGNWADKKAALTTLESFTGKQLEQFGTTIDSIAYSNPLDYINQKRLYNKASEDYSKMTGSTVTPSSSTVTPSSSTVTPAISKEAAIEELKRRGLIK